MNEDVYWAANVKRVALSILAQSQRDGATEVVFAPATAAGASVRYKVDDTWYDWAGPPAEIMPDLVAMLARLAGADEGSFPKTGTIDVPYSGLRLKWAMRMATRDTECVLTPV